MDKILPFSILILVLIVFGCTIYEEGVYAPPSQAAPGPTAEEASTYTLTQTIFAKDEALGYLLTYLEVPPASKEPQYFPAGTSFIKNLQFKNIGFISDKGKLFRFDENNDPVELGQFDVTRGLAVFFNRPHGEIRLRTLTP